MELENLLIAIIYLSLIAYSFACDCSKYTPSSTDSVEFKCTSPDGDSDDCNCVWFLINSTNAECLSCAEKPSDENKDYYYYARVLTKDNKPFCKSLGITGFPYAKIIKGTHQIVSDCKELGLLELGDECMQQNAIFEYPAYKDKQYPIIDGVYETKDLHCAFNYYRETQSNGLKYYICLEKNDNCANHGYSYYDSKTNECLHKCPENQPKLTELKKGEFTYYRCSQDCDYKDEEGKIYDKKYSKKSSLNSNYIDYCYKECPDESPYYFDDEKECRINCYNSEHKNYFILPSGHRCSKNIFECNQKHYFLINSAKKFFKCDETSNIENFDDNNCPTTPPYSNRFAYENRIFCLSNSDDKFDEFFGVSGTSRIDNQCTEDPCQLDIGNDLGEYTYNSKYVLGCKKDQYIKDKNCFDKCEDNNPKYFTSLKENNKCEASSADANCQKNYYDDITRGVRQCFNEDNCDNKKGYPYLIKINDSQNKCDETCNGVLSLDGKKCFIEDYSEI